MKIALISIILCAILFVVSLTLMIAGVCIDMTNLTEIGLQVFTAGLIFCMGLGNGVAANLDDL